jgi:aminodeoxyfutalosine synthase
MPWLSIALGDILAVGWLANRVRERMHGDKTYFNVNRHLNPTNVCVAASPPVRLRP